MTAARNQPLFRALAARGLDRIDCARACGVSVTMVYAWNAQTYEPSERSAARLAALIGWKEVREIFGAPPDLHRAVEKTIEELTRRGAHQTAESVRALLAG